MHKLVFTLSCALLIACGAPHVSMDVGAAPLRRDAPRPVEFVARFPHDPGAYTQGLVIAGGRLFESTGLHGRSTLREVDLETGRVTRSVALDDEFFGEGVTVHDGRVIQLTWRAGRGFIHDLATLERIGEFSYRGEGWGLTHDGERLVMSDGSATLRFLDPYTFEETGRVRVTRNGHPLRELNALQYRDGRVLANVWRTTYIAEIDPADGRVLAMHDLTPLLEHLGFDPELSVESPNGIAYDAGNGRLFVTGKHWPWLFEVRLR